MKLCIYKDKDRRVEANEAADADGAGVGAVRSSIAKGWP